MRRVLAIEARRSVAPWAALVLVVAALGYFYGLSGPWRHLDDEVADDRWRPLALWMREALIVLLPIAASAGVVMGSREHRSGVGELFGSVPRPGWQRTACAAAVLGASAVLAYAVVFGVVLVDSAGTGPPALAGWLPVVAVGALAVVAVAWLGLGIGAVLPSLLVVPAVAALALATTMFVAIQQVVGDTGRPAPGGQLGPVLMPPPDQYATVAAPVTGAQALWLSGLALTGLLLGSATSATRRIVAVVPLLLGLVAASTISPAELYVPDQAAVGPVCAGSVCVTGLHRQALPLVAAAAAQALPLLARLPGAPTTVREVPGTGIAPRDAAAVVLPSSLVNLHGGRTPTEPELVWAMLAGAGTPACSEVDSIVPYDVLAHEAAARAVAAAWFLGELRLPSDMVDLDDAGVARLAEPAWAALRALPPQEQLARITRMRAAALSCDGDPLTALTG